MRLNINLDLEHQHTVLRFAIKRVVDAVKLLFDGLGRLTPADIGAGPVPGTVLALHFGPPSPTGLDDAKYWIVEAGVRDVIKSIQLMLEETFVVAQIVRHKRENVPLDAATLQAIAEKRTSDALDFHKIGPAEKFDKLWTALGSPVPDELGERVEHAMTLVAARNCLEHRDGVVGVKDLKKTDPLVVRWRAFRVVDKDGNDLAIDQPTDGLEWRPHDLRERMFKLGDRILFTARDLVEICYALENLGTRLKMFTYDCAVVAGLPRAGDPPVMLSAPSTK